MIHLVIPYSFTFLALFLMSFPAAAQSEGETSIQGVPLQEQEAPSAGPAETLINYPEEMRLFIQRISDYGRSLKRNFVVLPKGNLEILNKIDAVDETKKFPARAFMRSIDGVIADGLFYGQRKIGQETNEERLAPQLELVKLAKRNRLNVMVIDYVANADQARKSYAKAREMKLTPFAADAMGHEMNHIPKFMKRPVNENPKSVMSLKDARNFLYLSDSSGYGRQDEFAMKMHDTNYDILVVDVMHGRRPLSRRAVETLKFKKVGGRRLVLASMDIGSAAAYHYYWKDNWREGSPSWINAPHPENPDRYYVQYWRPEWQNLIYGDTNSFVYGLFAQGFDGVVIEGLNSYRYFNGDLQNEAADEEQFQ